MSAAASTYMKQAAAQLQALDATLDRARDGAEEFQDEAAALQASIQEAAMRAGDLARRMKGGTAAKLAEELEG